MSDSASDADLSSAAHPTATPDADVDEALTFPDMPRTELETVITELTSRAQEVLAAQGRLRHLLRANAAVVSDISLPVVLRHIVRAARDLVGARYAALGVVGANGDLEQFVHVGMAAEQVQEIGNLPQGRGILGLLMSHPEPVRLADLSQHPASVGFPPNHPPMSRFLGVPIRVRGQVFGNLYLTDGDRAEFSVEDEQLVVSLAATAGVAIENARLFQEIEQQRQWLAASTELTQQLFTGQTQQPLELVLQYVVRGSGADLATLTMPDLIGAHSATESEQAAARWRIHAATGLLAEELVGVVVDLDHTVAGHVVRTGKPILVSDYSDQVGGQPVAREHVGAAIGVPLLGADERVLGALTVGRRIGAPSFTETDMRHLADFANHAGVALQLDRARADRESLRLIADHDRIAADLHDHVIQELFATGMGLQGVLGHLDGSLQQRVLGYVDSLDDTIRRIRNTIFQLHTAQRPRESLQQKVLAILDAEHAALGFHPRIDFRGPLDLAVPVTLADDVVAVVREAVSNVARHAQASTAQVVVALSGDVVTIEVIDDGRGLGNPSRSSGLTNMRQRARSNGGDLEISAGPAGGTRLIWSARIS